MPLAASSAGRVSRLNCGLWRQRGTVRTSDSRVTALAFSNAMNSARDRVEWPTVNTTVSDLISVLAARPLVDDVGNSRSVSSPAPRREASILRTADECARPSVVFGAGDDTLREFP